LLIYKIIIIIIIIKIVYFMVFDAVLKRKEKHKSA